IIELTKDFGFDTHFPIDREQMVPKAIEWGERATVNLAKLVEIEKKLRSLAKLREREPEKRWQAAYDLMLAQIVASQLKAFEYRACLQEMVQLAQAGRMPKPSKMPSADLIVVWDLIHSHEPKAPKTLTAKYYAEAERLLKQVIVRHPKTPWADLAQ